MPHKKHSDHDESIPEPEVKGQKRHVDEYSEIMRAENPSGSCLSAYIPKPTMLSIDIQIEDEHIILLMRQHLFTQLRWIFAVIVMLFLPAVFNFVGFFNFLPPTYHFAATLGWYMITAGFFIESFLKWFYRVYIITDERIIDVDFISMVYKDVSTTKIDKIEDVTTISSGFFSSIFDYGTIIVQTAATKQELNFENIPYPSRVSALLNELMLEEELEKYQGRVS